jgi:hypothetical protein
VKGRLGTAAFTEAMMPAKLGNLAQEICHNGSVLTFTAKAITVKSSLTRKMPMSFMLADEVGGTPAFTKLLTAVGLGNGLPFMMASVG